MKPVVRVTQQGFTHCPSCSQFIKITESASQTVCPFCEAPLRESVKAKPSEFGSKLKLFGRGALLAGALMGASVLAACDTEEEEYAGEEDAGTDMGEEDMGEEDVFNPNNSQSDYGGGGFNNEVNNDPEPAVYRFALVEDNTDPATGEFPGSDIDAIAVVKVFNPNNSQSDYGGGGFEEEQEFFATSVVDANIGDPNGDSAATDPSQLVGPPDADCDAQSGKFTALGGSAAGGYAIVEFGTAEIDVTIDNGDSVRIYELGATLCGMFDDDPSTVSVSASTDLGSFIEVGSAGEGRYTIPIFGLP
jgi:hypothetical protein